MIECPQYVGGSLRERGKVLRVSRLKKKGAAATVGVAVIGTLATVALGSDTPFRFGITPVSFGITGTETLVTANFDNPVQLNSDRVKFQTKGPTVVRVQKVVIGPGGYSGWHHHPGIVIVAVASGAVTVWHSDCSSKTYGPGGPNGAVFIEGGDDPGQVTNASATVEARVVVTFVAPSTVFRIDDHDAPSCT